MKNTIDILGCRINLEDYDSAIEKVQEHIDNKLPIKYVMLVCVDGLVNSKKNPLFRQICNNSYLSLPDGMPLVWIARRKGFKEIRTNVRGTSFMYKFFEKTFQKPYKHFFYGGKDGVADKMKTILEEKFNGVKIAGTYCPPFRKLTDEEDKEICDMINSSGADILWVGLGAPKQEYWMNEHQNKLNVSIMVGVGAAFDFLAGNKKEAPKWMGRIGLEWLFRLISEPKRLWKRYLIGNCLFIYWLVKDKITTDN